MKPFKAWLWFLYRWQIAKKWWARSDGNSLTVYKCNELTYKLCLLKRSKTHCRKLTLLFVCSYISYHTLSTTNHACTLLVIFQIFSRTLHSLKTIILHEQSCIMCSDIFFTLSLFFLFILLFCYAFVFYNFTFQTIKTLIMIIIDVI